MKINGMLSIQWIVLMNLILMSEANILGNSTWRFQPRVTTQSSKFTAKSLTQTSINVKKKHLAEIRNDSKPTLLTLKQSQNNNALNNFNSRIPQNLEGTDRKNAVTSLPNTSMNINTKMDLENFKQTEDMNNGQVYVHHSNKVLKEVEERLSNSGVTSEKNILRVYQGNKYIDHAENIIRAPNFQTEKSTRLVEASKDIRRLAKIVEKPTHVKKNSVNLTSKCKMKHMNNLISKFEKNSTILTKKEILKTRSGESLNNIILSPDENVLRVYQGKKFLDRKKKAYKPKKTYKLAKSTKNGKNIKKMKNNVISLNHKNITLYPKINASQLLKTNKTQRHIITVSTSSRDVTNMTLKNLKHNKQWLKRQQIPKKLYKDNFVLNYPSELSINSKNESDKRTKKQIYSIKILSPNIPRKKINETTSGVSKDINPIHRLHLQKKDGVHRQLQEFTDKLLETLKPNTEPTLKHLNKKIHKNILNLLKIFEPGENLTEDSKIGSNVTSAKRKNDSESSNGKKTIRVSKTKIFNRKKTKVSQQTNETGQKNRKSNGVATPTLILKEDIKVKSGQPKKFGNEPGKKDGFSSEERKKKTQESKSKVPKILKRDPLLSSNQKKTIEKMSYKRRNEVKNASTFKGNVTEKAKQSRKGDNAILSDNRKRKIENQRNQMVPKRGNKGAKYYTKHPTVTKTLDELVERNQRKIRKNGRGKMGSRNATRIEKKKKKIMATNFGTKNKNQQEVRRERMEEIKKRKKIDFKLKNSKKEIKTKTNPISNSKTDEKQARKMIRAKNDDFVNDSTSPANLVKSKKIAKTKYKNKERKNDVKTINADKRKLNNTLRMSIAKNEELKKQTIRRKSDENRFKFNETKNNTNQRNEKDANTFHQITNKTNQQLDNEIIKKINHKINPQKITNVKNKPDESNIIEKINVTNEKQGLGAEGTFERDVHENEIDDLNVWKNMSKRKEALLNDKRQIEVRNMDTIAGRILTVDDVKPTKDKRNEVLKSRFTRKLADKVDETVGGVSENQTSEPKHNFFVTSGQKTIRDTSKMNALEDVITSTRSFNASNFKLNSEEKKSLVEKLLGFPRVKHVKTTLNDKENISISPIIMELKVNRNNSPNNTQLSKPSGSPETKIFNNNLIVMDNKNRTTQIKSLVDEKVRKTRGKKRNRKMNAEENVEEISENKSGRKSKLENRKSRKKVKMNKKMKESSKDSTEAVTNKQTKRRDGKKEKEINDKWSEQRTNPSKRGKLKKVGKYNNKGKKGRQWEDEDLDVEKLEREKQRPGMKKKEKGMKKGVTEKKKRKEISKKKTSKKLDYGDDDDDRDDETFDNRMAKKNKLNRLKKVKKDKGRNKNVEIIKKKEEKKSKKTRRKEMRKDELRSRKPSSRQNTDVDEIPDRKPKPVRNKEKKRRKGIGVGDPEESSAEKQRGKKSKVKKPDTKRKKVSEPNNTDEKKAKVDKKRTEKKPHRKDKKYRRREEKQKNRKENIKEVRHIKEEEQNAITNMNSGNLTLRETLIDQSRKFNANESIANNKYRK